MVGTFLVAGDDVTLTYSDGGNTLTIAVTTLTERIQDVVGVLTGFGGSGLTFSYDDSGATVTLAVNVDDSTLEINSDTLRVKAGGILTTHIADANVTKAKLASTAVDNDVVNNTLEIPAAASLTWTPVFRQGSALTCTVNYAHYTRVGPLVTAAFKATFTNSGTTAQFLDVTLPVNTVYGEDMCCGGGRYFVDGSNRILGTWMASSSDPTRVTLDFSTLISMASFTVQSGQSVNGILSYLVN
jgi:hypothetical protein